jgi:hypothetical protein
VAAWTLAPAFSKTSAHSNMLLQHARVRGDAQTSCFGSTFAPAFSKRSVHERECSAATWSAVIKHESVAFTSAPASNRRLAHRELGRLHASCNGRVKPSSLFTSAPHAISLATSFGFPSLQPYSNMPDILPNVCVYSQMHAKKLQVVKTASSRRMYGQSTCEPWFRQKCVRRG